MRRTTSGRRTLGRFFTVKRINSDDLGLRVRRVFRLVSGLRTSSMVIGLLLLTLVSSTPAFAEPPEEKVAEATQALSIFSSMGPRLFRSMGPLAPGPSRDRVHR